MRKKYLCLTLIVCLAGTICIVGCGKKKKITYGDTPGVATGIIDLSGEDAKIDVENIIAPVGSDIDYTAGVEVVGDEDDDYSVKVNATNVKNDTPGTYNVGYTVTSNGKTQTSNIKVTITEDESVKKESISQNVVSSNKGETVVIDNCDSSNSNVGGSSNNNSNGSNTNNNSQNNNSDNNLNNDETTTIPNSENETTKNNTSTQKPSKEETTTKQETTTEKVLITGSNKATIKKQNLENAVIELLSGDVVTISCSTKKYIVATRTDESVVIKNGHNYSVAKLVVVFNTGEERTLETIEKKID